MIEVYQKKQGRYDQAADKADTEDSVYNGKYWLAIFCTMDFGKSLDTAIAEYSSRTG
ncbi:hypothetical protein [Zobellia amurskyensis]|uniref:hypothetical protein n=1 Tax=Zobellia amurskyensis TaxID=248905 RepID=UPI001F175506|nr:hypothetical protein [Zobellia amurskyensis]